MCVYTYSIHVYIYIIYTKVSKIIYNNDLVSLWFCFSYLKTPKRRYLLAEIARICPSKSRTPKTNRKKKKKKKKKKKLLVSPEDDLSNPFVTFSFFFFWRKKEKRDNTWVRYIWSSVIIVLEWKCMCRIDISCRYCVAIVVYIISFDCIYT